MSVDVSLALEGTMTYRSVSCSFAVAVAAVMSVGTARASYIGVGWLVPNAIAEEATLANANAQAGNNNRVNFVVDGLNFSSFSNPATNTGTVDAHFTLLSFLDSQGFLSGTPVYSGIVNANTSLFAGGNGMLFEFTGVANFTNGQQFKLTHDDGVQFYIGCTAALCSPANLVFDVADPTAPVTNTFTYTGPSGNLPFTFIYGECCSAPGVFQTTLVPAAIVLDIPPEPVTDHAPEPGTGVLFATTTAALVGLIRRQRSRVSR